MGFTDFVRNQFIDVIEYEEENNKIITYKYSRPGNEIKQGAKVIVRESQCAVFLKGGSLADILPAGTHTLNTDNLPLLSALGAIPYLFNSPIKSDLYFVSLRQFIGNEWETENPILLRDQEFNMVRITAFGKFSFQISKPEVFLREVFGTMGLRMSYDIANYLTSFVSESIAVILGQLKVPVLDLAAKYRTISKQITSMVNERAAKLGISFRDVIIENISLPEEVEQLIDEQSGIGMASRNMNNFMQYQTARAMRDASRQEGGLAGLGAGMAIGNQMAGAFHQQPMAAGQMAGTAQQQTGAVNQQTGASIQQTGAVNQPAGSGSTDTVQKLKEYKELLDSGIITQEEFDTLKRKMLNL